MWQGEGRPQDKGAHWFLGQRSGQSASRRSKEVEFVGLEVVEQADCVSTS